MFQRFVLNRVEDKSGISGTGCVAEGVQFSDSKCVIRWLTTPNSIAVYNDIVDVIKIHGHDGKTAVEWL